MSARFLAINGTNGTPGRCDICGRATVLFVFDEAANLRVGNCCYGELSYVHKNLETACFWSGLRHPAPGEFPTHRNH